MHAKEAVGHADSADQFGLKRGREQALQDDWINSVGTSWQSERRAHVARSEDIGQERDPKHQVRDVPSPADTALQVA